MANVTLSIDDDLFKRARILAIERDTSVSALVREYLKGLVGNEQQPSGIAGFLAIVEAAHASSGPGGRTWTRDELHER
jgi:plasmid stability protein